MSGRFPRIRLASRDAEPATLLIRGARLLDPRAGIDGVHDLVVRDGEIAEITAARRRGRDGGLSRSSRRRG